MYGEAASSNKIRVLILDSSPIHTELLAEALRRDHALEVARSDSATSMIRTALESAVDVLVISATLDEQRDRCDRSRPCSLCALVCHAPDLLVECRHTVDRRDAHESSGWCLSEVEDVGAEQGREDDRRADRRHAEGPAAIRRA